MFSFLITYRNRGQNINSIINCLESLKNQERTDFEVILINSGSTPKISQELATFCQSITTFKIKYIYTDTRGHFWNKSILLNVGLEHAEKPYVFVLDSDLFLPRGFLDYVAGLTHHKSVLVLSCYDLLKGVDIRNDNIKKLKKQAKKRPATGQGNVVVRTSEVKTIGGYDTFYRVWGREDIDLVDRLEKVGLEKVYIDNPDLPVFHQWHQPQSTNLPRAWLEVIDNYYKRNSAIFRKPLGKVLSLRDRPSLDLALRKALDKNKQFGFSYPKILSFNLFFKRFQNLESQDYFFIKQDFTLVKKSKTSRLRAFVMLLNTILKGLKISYRLADIRTYDTEFVGVKEIADFLFYFILHFESDILDYYFERKENHIFCIIFKK